MATNNDVATEAAAKTTKRVVLKREQVLVVPDGADPAKVAEAAKLLKVKATSAWVQVAAGEGSKTQAIEQHAGKPGTADAKQGVYKAPNLSAWRGGEVYGAPPQPLVERRALDDEEALS